MLCLEAMFIWVNVELCDYQIERNTLILNTRICLMILRSAAVLIENSWIKLDKIR